MLVLKPVVLPDRPEVERELLFLLLEGILFSPKSPKVPTSVGFLFSRAVHRNALELS